MGAGGGGLGGRVCGGSEIELNVRNATCNVHNCACLFFLCCARPRSQGVGFIQMSAAGRPVSFVAHFGCSMKSDRWHLGRRWWSSFCSLQHAAILGAECGHGSIYPPRAEHKRLSQTRQARPKREMVLKDRSCWRHSLSLHDTTLFGRCAWTSDHQQSGSIPG